MPARGSPPYRHAAATRCGAVCASPPPSRCWWSMTSRLLRGYRCARRSPYVLPSYWPVGAAWRWREHGPTRARNSWPRRPSGSPTVARLNRSTRCGAGTVVALTALRTMPCQVALCCDGAVVSSLDRNGCPHVRRIPGMAPRSAWPGGERSHAHAAQKFVRQFVRHRAPAHRPPNTRQLRRAGRTAVQQCAVFWPSRSSMLLCAAPC